MEYKQTSKEKYLEVKEYLKLRMLEVLEQVIVNKEDIKEEDITFFKRYNIHFKTSKDIVTYLKYF